ncbi:MAG: ABC transporter ATP-binding protein [Anaerolineae bacterium]
MDNAVRIENLSKTFGKGKKQVQAVKNVTLDIAAGQVFGFLGPNGAGKTTTIRMMLSLLRPTQGRVLLYGKDVQREFAVLRRAGAIVEGAAFYPYLSGRANLEVLALTQGKLDPQRINALLEQVGLAERAHQRFAGYSLGMKQRLGLAGALLQDPDILILDEPTNGLDPSGIQEMRTFIRELADKQGKTVVLSSHLLNEVEQICDRVAIINKGEIVREGTVKGLLAGKGKLRIEAAPMEKDINVLSERFQVTPNSHSITLEAEHDDVPRIVRQLVAADVQVYEVASQKQSLEEYFLAVTQGETHHG